MNFTSNWEITTAAFCPLLLWFLALFAYCTVCSTVVDGETPSFLMRLE